MPSPSAGHTGAGPGLADCVWNLTFQSVEEVLMQLLKYSFGFYSGHIILNLKDVCHVLDKIVKKRVLIALYTTAPLA